MNTINNGSFQVSNQSYSMKQVSSLANQSKAVYAEKGDVIYQKDMDKDEDGVITFQEFLDYCDENDISYAQRAQMLENRLNLQLHKDRAAICAEIKEIEPEDKAVYAEEGDENYKEEIDSNNDGKITYDEYMRYCEEQEKSQEKPKPEKAQLEEKEEKVIIKNEGKAINTYAKAETKENESKIKSEG